MGETKPKRAVTAPRRSVREWDEMLDRIAELIPVVREQLKVGNRAAIESYYREKGKPEPPAIPGGEFLEIKFAKVTDTPEGRELRSIGLAVAALGGGDVISEIGWTLSDRIGAPGRFVWSAWDGLAGHWL